MKPIRQRFFKISYSLLYSHSSIVKVLSKVF